MAALIPIPAVDISGGKAVRLERGRFDRMTRFFDDPLEAVARWVDAGARRVHLVDLDAAKSGKPVNLAVIEQALERWPGLDFQVAGGIRDMEGLERWMEAGARYPVLGTAAIEQPEFFRRAAERWPGRLILGLDARGGRVAVRGWTEDSGEDVLALAQRYADLPLAAIAHTDIDRDGTLAGPNIEASAELARRQPHPVLVSGGVRHLDDLMAVARTGLFVGVICGAALYRGKLDLAEALRLCAGLDGSATAAGPGREEAASAEPGRA